MSERCTEQVRDAGSRFPRYHQCQRAAVKDGYCAQHHPDSKKARYDESIRRWNERQKNSPAMQLQRALQEIDQLKVELAELKEKYHE
jgi:hypothetical protein